MPMQNMDKDDVVKESNGRCGKMRRAFSGVLVLAFVLALCPMFAIASGDHRAEVEQLINKYFSYRAAGYKADSNPSEVLKSLTSVEGDVRSSVILSDEKIRQGRLLADARRQNISYSQARTTPYIAEYREADGVVEATVYEWTFIDYVEKGYSDTMGIGVWHRMTFSIAGGKPVLLKDDYDEGPGTGMKSSTFVESNPIAVPTTWAGITIDEQDTMKAPELRSIPGYNVLAMVEYSDSWVSHTYDGHDHTGLYNNEQYQNFSPNDCANFVSQCLSAGGVPQVPGSWSYSFNEEGTDDDAHTTSWTYVPSHRSYFAQFNPVVDDPVAADIIIGNPIYMDWDGVGGWNHATICVGTNDAGTPIINCHSVDSWHRRWNYGEPGCRYSTVKLGGSQTPPFVSLSIISPNGGEVWESYSTHVIQWNVGSVTGNVKVQLSTNGGSSWQDLASSTPNDGYYSWYVVGVSPTTQAKIRVTSLTNASSVDTSDSVFQITDASK